jgi:hypothetical protein
VVADRFVAGFVVEDGRVTACAPILKRHLAGKTEDDAKRVIAQQGWRAHLV